MENNVVKTYRSKVSKRLVAFVFLAFYGPLIFYINDIHEKAELLFLLILTLFFIFTLSFILGIVYSIENDKLIIKVGLFKYKPIDILEIKEVSKTNSIISAPAASFDRIEIKYGQYDEVVISPNDQQGFVNELKRINPKIINNLSSTEV